MAESSRVVLVTGGSKGIGRTLAERFRDAGYRVAATYRSGGVPDGVLGLQCDITDQEQVEAAFTAVEEAKILADYHKRLGADVEVVLTRVSEIPPEKSGKYRYVVSHVPTATGTGDGHA